MNKKLKRIIFPLFYMLIILGSCKDIKEGKGWEADVDNVEDFLNAFEKEVDITAENFIDDTTNLLKPYRFRIFNNYMLINDKYNDYIYSVFDMKNKSLIGRFVQKGRGPNEYLNPYLNNYGTDSIMVFDRYKQKIAIFSLKKIEKCDNIPDRIISFNHTNRQDAVEKVFCFNKLLLTTGLFKQNRFKIYDINGSAEYSFGSYPLVSSEVASDNYHLGFIFGGNEEVESDSQSNKFACINKSSLSIYNFNNKLDNFLQAFNIQWSIQKIKEATYKDGKPYVVRYGNGQKIGAGSLAVNDKYLFFPFSKNEYKELMQRGITQDFFDYILVMDWNGSPVAKLKLNKRIKFPLEIDKEGKHLYCTHTDIKTGFPQVIRFDISFLNQKNVKQ